MELIKRLKKNIRNNLRLCWYKKGRLKIRKDAMGLFRPHLSS
jgi:hypothetical protein